MAGSHASEAYLARLHVSAFGKAVGSAQMLPKFFKHFPELSEQALDQHISLCEDEELGVLVQAIRGLPLFCKDTPEHLVKIVDILGQLLIAGDIVERDAVHKALTTLLRQDVKSKF
ncbi:apoptosis inhibitor 5 [Striga asiatica]|uniref:Apoptosis inhibitor 5 n=1 Tax=Striga asiatica TaxID=4170 RepID=A0A5A7PCZ9_STRAF|nr:apoptosis inhibitor 5 [Striga asiatica]